MVHKQELFFNKEADSQIKAYCNDKGELYIEISEVGNNNFDGFHFITLNKDTAKSLVSSIQKEIKFLKDE